MKLADAKKVLAGKHFVDRDEMFEITLWDKDDISTGIPISLNYKDIEFMLRALALKVEREKGK